MGTSISLSHINSRGVLTGALSPGTGVLLPGAAASALLFPPTLPVLDEGVPGGYTFEDDRGRNLPNPVADASENLNLAVQSLHPSPPHACFRSFAKADLTTRGAARKMALKGLPVPLSFLL